MSKRNIILFLFLSVLAVGTVCGQEPGSIDSAKSVKIPIWDNGFRIGLTSQAQLVLPATLSADDPYVKSQPGFGGENGIELSYHFGYFGVSLGLTFGTFRVFNFKPHFDDAPGADLDDPDFCFYNLHHYSMVHNVFLPLKFEFHYPFNDKFAIMADIGTKLAVGYQLMMTYGDMWITTYEEAAMKPLFASLVTDVGFYYRLPYGDLIRGSIGANVGFQHVTDGEYSYQNPSCNVEGSGTFFSRNTNFNVQAAYIHTFHRYKQRRVTETAWKSELPRHEFQFNVGDPVLTANSSNIGFDNFFYSLFREFPFIYSPTYWTHPIGDYPITRIVPTFSFNYHYRAAKWLWVGGLTTVSGLHNTWHDRFTDEVTGHGSEVHVTLMPDLRFSYLNREHVTLYSGFGLGLNMKFMHDPHLYGEDTQSYYGLAYQLTAFGVKAGAKHWFGNLELGYGDKGIISAGFGYEF